MLQPGKRCGQRAEKQHRGVKKPKPPERQDRHGDHRRHYREDVCARIGRGIAARQQRRHHGRAANTGRALKDAADQTGQPGSRPTKVELQVAAEIQQRHHRQHHQ
jgi:hypothetical protein